MQNLRWEDAGEGIGRLMITGDATVEMAEELQRVLLEGLERYGHVQIDCSLSQSMDFFTVQLLCSAHRTAFTRGKRFTFHGNPASPLTETIGVLGFRRNEACALCPRDISCLWV
jgi:anti-anti-sigma regulatory factor